MVFLRRCQIEGKYDEVSYLPSNGISPTSTGEKFDEETNTWRFSLYLRYCPKSQLRPVSGFRHLKRGEVVYLFLSSNHLVKEDGSCILHCRPFIRIRMAH